VQIDSLALVLVTAGILLAVAAAILVGTLTARLFFHASRGDVEEAIERRHEVSR
jgi:sensor domain CHASE-containing protein